MSKKLEKTMDSFVDGVNDMLEELKQFNNKKSKNKRSTLDANDLMMTAKILESAGKGLAVKMSHEGMLQQLKTIEIKEKKLLN